GYHWTAFAFASSDSALHSRSALLMAGFWAALTTQGTTKVEQHALREFSSRKSKRARKLPGTLDTAQLLSTAATAAIANLRLVPFSMIAFRYGAGSLDLLVRVSLVEGGKWVAGTNGAKLSASLIVILSRRSIRPPLSSSTVPEAVYVLLVLLRSLLAAIHAVLHQ
ncbi:hypothetical protein H4582DRAFT_2002518, partial [Lactarius indigo]